MVLDGYIGTAPTAPSIALSFDVLEVYRQYHRVPYWKGLVAQFSNTYDIYLDILDRIDNRVRAVLKQDTPEWWMCNACAPCLYTLENESKLSRSMLVTMDGNQSLKLVDSAFRSGTPLLDSRQARTDYWIPTAEVDRFKDEVGQAKDINGSPEEVASICVERWQNAGPESRKKMFALFAVSSVFVCLCRHGHILIMCDMIRSGELMKYPLAIINKLLEVYGPDILVGYDIGCEFSKTLHHSSLGPRIEEHHNCGCQVRFHPLYFVGAGKEDFEECERLFSESNGLASGTRLATPFHRCQAIEEFAKFWSCQKHAKSGNFIYNNYKQALNILSIDAEAFDVLARQLSITHQDCDQYLEQEQEYLAKCKTEPPEVAVKIDYIAAANKHEAEIKRVRTRARTAHSRWAIAEENVLQIEDDLGIEKRWMSGSREYLEALEELQFWKYRCVLDNLERLVIQRMFELTKLGMSGYKLRKKISKALKTRAEAIRHALDEYNKCAAALPSPQAALSWHDIMEMASLAEFDLLRDTREDVREYPWAKRLNRQAMNLHFNILRAHEEIECLDVEIPRLFTSLVDRHYNLQMAIAYVADTDPALAHELRVRWACEDRISARIAARLYETSQLKGFSGKLVAGTRIGHGVPENGLEVCQSGGKEKQVKNYDKAYNDDVSDNVISGVEDEGEAV
ncbi:hypothetical protein L226DRAFT_548449 [Lentinus tigrinus ALCF2SS1-7]|uniref:CxC1-like cysteine cluster associated with KDZ transposases domain-containing protein n=1 Tax=Lentinus tigrinus ALCF2SS1-6 TaxID=1328759 RepID=A0A5C2RSB8_9APHY|nr:hypothetical protein L227DRAFT_589341 [Lentinus tigrinus ALCF2SS1-6]RPD68650.1 hypothetical protein L226DRAFT_548449 [Lentinus tigrinus ALCF2SS1-7]